MGQKIGKIVIAFSLIGLLVVVTAAFSAGSPAKKDSSKLQSKSLPRLVDLGSDKCIPCKMMAPILEELKSEYAGRMEVEFIDIFKNRQMSAKYKIRIIPTQVFIDSSGKELFRHEGFYSKEDMLSKWKELGVDLSGPKQFSFSRLEPVKPDTRRAGGGCYMCDGDNSSKTRVILKTDKGDVYLCSPHCYFITYSSLLDNKGMDEKVFVTDWSTGESLSAIEAIYLCGLDAGGRAVIKSFADKQAALKERGTNGGNILGWEILKEKELVSRCGFCDRAVYPEDAAVVKAGGVHTWGCCPMCALGVAARTKQDVEIYQKDALTGEMIHVKTTNGSISLLEPETAAAWSGKKKLPDGKLVSAGCFKQGFFVNEENLKKWVEQNPRATGMMIPIQDALAAKMKLSEEQIMKACKIGECVPK
jgi:thioredoxin 1